MYLYLIKSNNHFKIGVASEIEARLRSLQIGNPVELIIHSCFEFGNATYVEQSIHQKFIAKRERGEWFSLNDADLDEFENICTLLGGKKFTYSPSGIDSRDEEEDIAEVISKTPDETPSFDIPAMLGAGWRVEISQLYNGNYRYWYWRQGSASKRHYIPGGRLDDAPEEIIKLIGRKRMESVWQG